MPLVNTFFGAARLKSCCTRSRLWTVSGLQASETLQGLRLIPLADLVRMKLTSFRAKDETHLMDLDEAGLITPEIEAALPPVLADRLAQARAR